MEIKKWVKRGLIGARIAGGIAQGAATANEFINIRAELQTLRVQNNALRQELTSEEVDRCLTDVLVTKILNNSFGQRFVEPDCSVDYKPKFTPEDNPQKGSRSPVRPTPSRSD